MDEAERRLFTLSNTAALLLFSEHGNPPTLLISQKVLAEHGASLLKAYKETVVAEIAHREAARAVGALPEQF